MSQAASSSSRRLMLTLGAVALVSAGSASAWGWPFGASIEGNGQKVQQVRPVAAFERIRASDSIDIEWRQGDQDKVEVVADANLQPLIMVKVDGSELQVSMDTKGQSFRTLNPLKVVVVSRSLKGLSLNGSGDAWVGPFTTPAFSLQMKGSGDVKLVRLQAQSLDVDLLGSGEVKGEGSAGQLKIRVRGSGDVSCEGLVADDGEVELLGSGDVKVRVERSLKAVLRGSGDIEYSGKVAKVDADVRGSGALRRTGG